MFPTARSANLTVQELADETLIFDHQNHKAHCLNRTTALVWKLCDGRTSLAAMAQKVGMPRNRRTGAGAAGRPGLAPGTNAVAPRRNSEPPPRGVEEIGRCGELARHHDGGGTAGRPCGVVLVYEQFRLQSIDERRRL